MRRTFEIGVVVQHFKVTLSVKTPNPLVKLLDRSILERPIAIVHYCSSWHHEGHLRNDLHEQEKQK